jgi:hypothetical protein
MVVLHGGHTHWCTVLYFRKVVCQICFGWWKTSTWSKGIRQSGSPDELNFQPFPSTQQSLEGDSNRRRRITFRIWADRQVFAGSNEIAELGQEPDERVAQHFLPHRLLICVTKHTDLFAGYHKARIIQLEACCLP